MAAPRCEQCSRYTPTTTLVLGAELCPDCAGTVIVYPRMPPLPKWGGEAACAGMGSEHRHVEDLVGDNKQGPRGLVRQPGHMRAILWLGMFCRTCPIIDECHRWATKDAYTGVAGGWVFRNGQAVIPAVHIDEEAVT